MPLTRYIIFLRNGAPSPFVIIRQFLEIPILSQLNLISCETHKVGLKTISLYEDPQSLSGGFKRRLAFAIQLVLCLLDYYELMYYLFLFTF